MSAKSHPKISRILVVVGPTASGKTQIALRLAERLNGEILSADSRQMYKLMSIGTAQPSPGDLKRITHHFVADRFPDQEFNAAEFGVEGRKIIDRIFSRHKIPIVAGGSGLYIQGLIDGFFEGAEPDERYRKLLYDRIATEGSQGLLDELRCIDPEAASAMLPSNTRRIVRALETFHLTGKPISELQKERAEIGFRSVLVGIAWDRKKLYERINRRVDEMLASGLVDEVKTLIAKGYSPELKALQTVGYREVFAFLDGRITHDGMVELIKRNTRRYAKRQLTWFRNDERVTWFPISDESEFETVTERITEHVLQFCTA